MTHVGFLVLVEAEVDVRMTPQRRHRMRPGQTWERLRRGFMGSYRCGAPVTLVRRDRTNKKWLVLDLATGETRLERFTTRDLWVQVA